LVNALALNGKKVVTSDFVALGEVEGVEVNTDNWTVTNLRVTLTKQAVQDLNLEPPILWIVVISLPTKYIQTYNESITLNIPFTEITNLTKTKPQPQ
jgi:sporulation protein YlmC with PRC-barrel domain